MEPFLHIVNSPAFLSILSTGGISSGDIKFIGDNFADGPICDTQSAQEWKRSRLDFWRRETTTIGSNEKDLIFPDLDAHLPTSSICYWLGPDLSSAVCLAWLSSLYEHRRITSKRLSIVPVFRHPRTGQPLPRVGLLQPGDIKWDQSLALALQPDESVFLAKIWRAVTSDTPLLLDQLKAFAQPARLPIIDAVRGLKFYFPLVSKGVSTVTLRILEILRGGRQPLSRVLTEYIVRFADEPSFYGDLALRRELLALGSAKLSAPLLNVTGSPASTAEVSITSHGHDVLEGKLDHVHVNGIDRWVGGVHLDSSLNNIWRYDSQSDRFLAEKK